MTNIFNKIKAIISSNKGSVKIIGRVRLVAHDAQGRLKFDTGFRRNIITSAGKAEVANLVGNVSSPTAFTYLAVGTSTTAESAAQTALIAEVSTSGLARASATMSRVTTTTTNDTLRFVKSWSVSGTVTVEEIGIFNASSSGTMLGRKLTTSKAVVNGDTLTATYDVIFA